MPALAKTRRCGVLLRTSQSARHCAGQLSPAKQVPSSTGLVHSPNPLLSAIGRGSQHRLSPQPCHSSEGGGKSGGPHLTDLVPPDRTGVCTARVFTWALDNIRESSCHMSPPPPAVKTLAGAGRGGAWLGTLFPPTLLRGSDSWGAPARQPGAAEKGEGKSPQHWPLQL